MRSGGSTAVMLAYEIAAFQLWAMIAEGCMAHDSHATMDTYSEDMIVNTGIRRVE